MIDVKQIAIGFVNNTRAELGVGNPEVEKKAVERYEHCYQCEVTNQSKSRCDSNKQGSVVKDFFYEGKHFNKGDLNIGCGCWLQLKIRSNAYCPLNKWERND